PGSGGARSAPGDPAARHLSRFARRFCRHGGSHQRRLDRRTAATRSAAGGESLIMEIKVGFEISYAAVQPTPMVIMLSIHPSRFSDIVGIESIVTEPSVPIGFYRDSFGNVCGRLVAPAGGVTFRGQALVRDSGLPDIVMPTAQQVPIDQLPDELLLYLMPSRYCETDKLTDIAWSLFGNTAPGWQRVEAITAF